MSWLKWACIGIVVLGFVLFIYGANVYDAAVGFAGIFFLVGIIGLLILYIYSLLTKKPSQNP